MHGTKDNLYAMFSAYGFMQSLTGFTSGYFTARWIYYHHPISNNSREEVKASSSKSGEEETPLLVTPSSTVTTPRPADADIGEASVP